MVCLMVFAVNRTRGISLKKSFAESWPRSVI